MKSILSLALFASLMSTSALAGTAFLNITEEVAPYVSYNNGTLNVMNITEVNVTQVVNETVEEAEAIIEDLEKKYEDTKKQLDWYRERANQAYKKAHGYVKENKTPLGYAVIAIIAYFLYRKMTAKPAQQVQHSSATHCHEPIAAGAPVYHYPLWNPPTLNEVQPLVQKTASDMI